MVWAFGLFLILAGVLWVIWGVLPASKAGEVPTTLYVAANPLATGGSVTANQLQTETLDLPPGFGSSYLTPANLGNYASDFLAAPVSTGSLIPLSLFTQPTNIKNAIIPITFKQSPNLAAGDVVDVILVTQTAGGVGGPEVLTLLRNVTLMSGPTAGSWQISVPANLSTALIYASGAGALDAVQVDPGNKVNPGPPVSSINQAISALQAAGVS